MKNGLTQGPVLALSSGRKEILSYYPGMYLEKSLALTNRVLLREQVGRMFTTTAWTLLIQQAGSVGNEET